MENLSREVELELIELMAYERLCEEVEITPLVQITPGRGYNENGELSSWYEEKRYPKFTKSKQKKLLNYILMTKEAPSLIAHITKLLIETGKLEKDKVKELLETKKRT